MGLERLQYMFFFNKHSVFQSEARICLSFSQIQPQNMLKICLSKKVERSKFHYLTHAGGRELAEGIKMKNILTFVPSRLLKSLI